MDFLEELLKQIDKTRDNQDEYFISDRYTFYYDETGNERKFVLSENGYNSENALNNDFILGGVVYPGFVYSVNFDELYNQLGYSQEQKEIKFRHLYLNSRDFLMFIGSKRLTSYIQWLDKSGLYVHYCTVNNLYFSLVDIVDSLFEMFPAIIGDLELNYNIKNALYSFVNQNRKSVAKILIKYGYPNIQNCQGFCNEIYNFIDANNEVYSEPMLELLCNMLKEAESSNTLVFIQDNIPKILIESYSDFYINRCRCFRESKHIFDEEPTVQKKLNNVIFDENGKQLNNFCFCKSENNKFIQISDLWCGVLGKLFRFLDDYSETELKVIKENLNQVQIENLNCIWNILRKSDNECQSFICNINPIANNRSRTDKLMTLL